MSSLHSDNYSEWAAIVLRASVLTGEPGQRQLTYMMGGALAGVASPFF